MSLFYTAMISGEKEFLLKSAHIFIQLNLWHIAITYKYIGKHNMSMNNP